MTLALSALLLAGLSSAPNDDLFELDRAAILRMAGTYSVTFRFEETVACRAGYEPEELYEEHATELVRVIEDRGDFIRLQHILVIHPESDSPHIVKHWRQDWTYEDTELFLHRGHETWETVEVPAHEAQGRWSQAVFQVGGAPRYEALGRWIHVGEVSTWEGDPIWRPLPRREEHRIDYDVIVARNRQTVTPAGWEHEQDNRKLALTPEGVREAYVAHETGWNSYVKSDLELGAGQAYWDETSAYWRQVRATWSELLREPGRYAIDSASTMRTVLKMADDYRGGRWGDDSAGLAAELRGLLRPTVERL